MMYGISSSGATLYFHYCCGKLVNIEISSANAHCGDEHQKGTKSCCKTKQISSSDNSFDYFPSINKYQHVGIINNQVFNYSTFQFFKSNSFLIRSLPKSLPPPLPIYISNRTFLI